MSEKLVKSRAFLQLFCICIIYFEIVSSQGRRQTNIYGSIEVCRNERPNTEKYYSKLW